MFSLSVHGVTVVDNIDVNDAGTASETGGWITLQVLTRMDTFNKNSPVSMQSITLFFEDLENGVDSFMEQLENAYQKWQQEGTVLYKKEAK